jgi:glycerophosphoryl diester phosphodiesterase
VIALAAGAAGCAADPQPFEPFEPPAGALCDPLPEAASSLQPLESHGFVAHAGGSPQGLLQEERYTNAREAFEVAYANGFRVFEFDLVLLGDGDVVVAHDFHEHEYGFSDGSFPRLSRTDLEGARWRGQYALMFGEDLIELMVEYPDVWVILDTKLDGHVEIDRKLIELAPDDSVRDRMVPHLASEEHVAALAEIYPFPEQMVAVYRWGGSDSQQVERMQRLGIDNIMMWWDSRWSETTQATLDAAGANVWVHSPDDPDVIRDFRGRGVGVYSNGWIDCGATD